MSASLLFLCVPGAARGDSVDGASVPTVLPLTLRGVGRRRRRRTARERDSCTAHTWEFRVVVSCVCTLRGPQP